MRSHAHTSKAGVPPGIPKELRSTGLARLVIAKISRIGATLKLALVRELSDLLV